LWGGGIHPYPGAFGPCSDTLHILGGQRRNLVAEFRDIRDDWDTCCRFQAENGILLL
jgi:hypothetical protein